MLLKCIQKFCLCLKSNKDFLRQKMDNFKKRIESAFEKLEKDVENIISEAALIEILVPKTEEALAILSCQHQII